MPLHAAGLSRRTFLAQGAAAIAGITVLRNGWGAESGMNPNRMVLLSDTHIPSTPDVTAHNTNMTSNLRQVVKEILALETKPAAVLINGDCAYLKGLPADYANLANCVAPLSEARLPLHMTMGNHDDRGPFYDALKAQKPERPLLASKHLTLIESPMANWYLLDSLTQVNVVTGEIGVEQRAWLDQALGERPHKPALVVAHHTPQFDAPVAGQPWGGIKDTTEFIDLLARHPHVKAFIFGHSHNWSVTKRGALQLINLPPVAYLFAAGKPNGWVLAETSEKGLSLELKTIDPQHKQNGERVELAWQ